MTYSSVILRNARVVYSSCAGLCSLELSVAIVDQTPLKYRVYREIAEGSSCLGGRGMAGCRTSPDLSSEQSSLLQQGHSLASIGDIKSSIQAYSKAVRIGPVEKETLSHLVSVLLNTTKNQRSEGNAFQSARTRPGDNNGELLYCSVCRALLLEPTTLSCGHTFCKSCVVEDGQFITFRDCCRVSMINECIVKVNVLLASVARKSSPSDVIQKEEKNIEGKKSLLEGQTNKAKQCFSAVLDSFPCDVTALCGRCDANTKLGLHELALQDAETACRCCPGMAKALLRKADALMKLRKTEEAVFTYLQCKAIVPNSEVCHEKLLVALTHLFSPHECTKEAVSSHKSSFIRDSDREAETSDPVLRENVNTIVRQMPNDGSGVKRDELECKLCYNVLFQPVTTPCGHSFCRDCLQRNLDHRLECPCCRAGLGSYMVQRKMNVTIVLENLVKQHFESEYAEREQRYLKELHRLKRVGHDEDVEIPIFCCTVAFPTVKCPLHIFEPRYRLMMRRCIELGSRQFGMCLGSTDPQKGPFAEYGTMLHIGHVQYLPDGRSVIHTVGGRRFHVVSHSMMDGYPIAKVKWIRDTADTEPESLAQLNTICYNLLHTWFCRLSVEEQNCVASALGPLPACESITASADGPAWVWWALASLPLQGNFKVIILAMTSLRERLKSIERFLSLLLKRLEGK